MPTTKQRIWLFDIDGTAALMNGRGPYDWSRVGEDLPNRPVIRIIRMVVLAGENIGFVSGRKKRCERQTVLWLTANTVLPSVPYLWMRADDDDRPDQVVKRELYERDIEPYFEVEGVFDDRNKVVALWRSLGLTCFQVSEGPDEDKK